MTSNYREYENGVADVIEFLVGDRATVSRDVHIEGFDSGTTRQIDILVEGRQFGIHPAKLIIDCKNYAKNLDVNSAGGFVSMVKDVRAESGWLVTTRGYSKAAEKQATSARGVAIYVMPLDELLRWRPK